MTKSSIQKTLEEQGIPVNQARAAASVLEREITDANSNPPVLRERTEEEQHAVSSAWEWFAAKTRSN